MSEGKLRTPWDERLLELLERLAEGVERIAGRIDSQIPPGAIQFHNPQATVLHGDEEDVAVLDDEGQTERRQ